MDVCVLVCTCMYGYVHVLHVCTGMYMYVQVYSFVLHVVHDTKQCCSKREMLQYKRFHILNSTPQDITQEEQEPEGHTPLCHTPLRAHQVLYLAIYTKIFQVLQEDKRDNSIETSPAFLAQENGRH